jgi:hypothetical protein
MFDFKHEVHSIQKLERAYWLGVRARTDSIATNRGKRRIKHVEVLADPSPAAGRSSADTVVLKNSICECSAAKLAGFNGAWNLMHPATLFYGPAFEIGAAIDTAAFTGLDLYPEPLKLKA